MAIGLLVGLFIGFVFGLAFAIWIVHTAGYEWRQVLHRWRIEMVYRRNREEIDIESEALEVLINKPFSELMEWLRENPEAIAGIRGVADKFLTQDEMNILNSI